MKTFLYAVRRGRYIKIGRTVNVRARMGALSNSSTLLTPADVSGKPLKILAIVAGDTAEEQLLLRSLSRYRVTGEWFKLNCVKESIYRQIFEDRETIGLADQQRQCIYRPSLPAALRWRIRTAAALSQRSTEEWFEQTVESALTAAGFSKLPGKSKMVKNRSGAA